MEPQKPWEAAPRAWTPKSARRNLIIVVTLAVVLVLAIVTLIAWRIMR